MAKKEKVDLDRIDDFDLEDNWGLDSNPGQVQDGKGDRNPVKKAGKTVLREMGKTAFSSQMAKAIMKEALPPSFSTTLDNADKALYDTRTLYQDVRKSAAPMFREMKSLGRNLNRLVPTRYQSKINELLKDNTDNSGKQLAGINLEDAAVLKSIGDIFGQEQDKPLSVEEITEKLTDQEYKAKLGSSIAAIQNLMTKQVAYQFGVQRAFQKKSMELQIRQLMVSRAHLDVAQKSAIETSNLLRSVVENTGLPDVVKQQRSEEFMRMAREKLFGRVQQNMYDWTANYRGQIKDRLKQTVNDRMQKFGMGLSMANSTLEQVEMQREMLASMGITPAEFMAGAAGNWGALQIGKRVGKGLRRFVPRLGKLDGTFQGANYLYNNKERLASEWGNSGYRYGKWWNPAENFLKDVLRSNYKDGGVVRSGGLSNGGQKELSIEDRKLSYMEETVGYLSRILHSIEIMRTGDTKLERTVFNRQKGTFGTFSDSVASTRQSLLKDSDIEAQRDNVVRLISSIDPTGKLTGKAKEKVVGFLLGRARTSKAFNPAQLANERISGLSREEQSLWQGLLAKRYGLKLNEKNEWSLDPFSSSNVNLNIDAGQYNYTSNQTQSLFNKAHALAQNGNLDELIQDGAVVFKNGNWELNPEYYANRVAGKRPGKNESPIPPNGNGPRPGPSGSGNADSLRRFGLDWSNPDNVNFNINRQGSGFTGDFKTTLSEQTDRIIDTLTKGQGLMAELGAAIEAQLADLHLGGYGGEGDTGSAGNDTRRARRRRFRFGNLLRNGVRRSGQGIKGLWDLGGLPFKGANEIFKRIRRPAFNAAMTIGTFGLNKVFGYGMQAFEKAQDGYVRTATGIKKVIDKNGLSTGRYIDQASGKVIKKLSDIKGAVWDVVSGTQVISDDDARGGLFNAKGERVKTAFNKTVSALGSLVTGRFTPYNLIKSALGVGGKGLGSLLNGLPDIYVLGETSPRLYANKIARGDYYSLANGKVIKKLSDIIDGVGVLDPRTRQLTPVLTVEDAAKGLVDKRGRPIRTGLSKLLGMAGRGVRGAFNFATGPLRLLNAMGKTASNMMTAGVRTVGNVFTGGALGGRGGMGNSSTSWLKRIYRLLVNQFTGKDPLDGLSEEGAPGSAILSWVRKGRSRLSGGMDKLKDRAGSWWNRLREGKPGTAKPEHAEKAAKESGGWGKLIWAAVSGVGAIIGKAVSGFGTFFKWIRQLPKWIGAAKAAGGITDALGDLVGGGKKGKWLRKGGRLLKNVGRFGLRAAGLVGRGLLSGGGMLARTALTAGASLLSAPVAITVAAAAGLGYLIYKGYQAYKNRMTPLRQYRAAAYGISPKDTDKSGKVLALEEAVLKSTRIDGNGKAHIADLPFQDLLGAFGVEMTDQRNVLRWTRWYQRRFVPVFTKSVEVLHRMDPKAKITDPEFLKESERPDYARSTFIASSGDVAPYLISDSPFPNFSSVTGDDFVAKYRDQVITEYQKAETAAIASGEKKVVSKSEVKQPGAVQQVNQRVARNDAKGNRKINPVTDLYYSPGDTKAVTGNITGDARRDELIQIGNRIDDLTAVRMKLYGLGELVKDDVNTLLPLETEVMKFVRYGDKGVATFTGNAETFFASWGGQFTASQNNAEEKNSWMAWFNRRFLPVFLNFCSESNFISPNASPLTAWRRLNASDLLKIANFMNGATTLIGTNRVSVWAITASPWPNRKSNTDSSVIQSNLDALRAASKKEVYSEKVRTQEEVNKMSFDGKALRSTALGSKIADLYTDNKALTATSSGRATGSGTGSYGQNMSTQGTSFERAGGSNYTDTNLLHTGQGSGGSINDLPVPNGDGWGNVKGLIAAVAKMTGVDAGSLAAMIAQESRFEINAKNGNSSAAGLGQFLDGTWREMVPILVKKYGMNPNTSQRDPRAAVLATAEYMKQNAKIIGDIGRPLTTTDIYMAHFLGPGGAKKVLGVPSNTPIAQAMGKQYEGAAKANKEIFAGVQTTGDLIASLGRYLSKNGGQYVEEANALTMQTGATLPGATTPSKDNGTPETPPLPQTPSTPNVSKGEMPMGNTENVATFNRGTEESSVTPTRPSDNRDALAISQQNKQKENAEGAARKAIAEKRSRDQQTQAETNNWVDTLNKQLEVQKSMDKTLSAIKEVLEKGGVLGSSSTSEKTPDNSAQLKGNAPGMTKGGNRPKMPFSTDIGQQYR